MDDSGPALAAARARGIRRHRHLIGAAGRPSCCRPSARAASWLACHLAGPATWLTASAQGRCCQPADRRSRFCRAAVAAPAIVFVEDSPSSLGFACRSLVAPPPRPGLGARAGPRGHLAVAPISAARVPTGRRPRGHRADGMTVPMSTAQVRPFPAAPAHARRGGDLRSLLTEPGIRTVMLDGSRDLSAGLTMLLIPDGADQPRLAVKLATNQSAAEVIDRELRLLTELQRRPMPSVDPTLPRPAGMFDARRDARDRHVRGAGNPHADALSPVPSPGAPRFSCGRTSPQPAAGSPACRPTAWARRRRSRCSMECRSSSERGGPPSRGPARLRRNSSRSPPGWRPAELRGRSCTVTSGPATCCSPAT